MEDVVKITEFSTNEISEEERNKASEKTYEQAEQSIRNEKMLKSDIYPKEVIMKLEESNRIGTIRAETVQELVRCKDCKHNPKYTKDFAFGRCVCCCEDDWYGYEPEDNFFCGYGER